MQKQAHSWKQVQRHLCSLKNSFLESPSGLPLRYKNRSPKKAAEQATTQYLTIISLRQFSWFHSSLNTAFDSSNSSIDQSINQFIAVWTNGGSHNQRWGFFRLLHLPSKAAANAMMRWDFFLFAFLIHIMKNKPPSKKAAARESLKNLLSNQRKQSNQLESILRRW